MKREFNPVSSHFAEAVCASSQRSVVSVSGLQTQRWQVSPANVTYQNNQYHTLSLYLTGGHRSYRCDQKDRRGAPDMLCIMPEYEQTTWSVRDNIEFLHIYIPQASLERFMALNFSQDIRKHQLQDAVYHSDPHLTGLLKQYNLNLSSGMSFLTAEQLEYELLFALLDSFTSKKVSVSIKAGLSDWQISRVREFVAANIDHKLTIAGMADSVNVSPFHFAKMFKMSFGLSPAQYVLHQRVNEGIRLLRRGVSPADASLLAGFSHQSHMTAVFKKKLGLTPKRIVQETDFCYPRALN